MLDKVGWIDYSFKSGFARRFLPARWGLSGSCKILLFIIVPSFEGDVYCLALLSLEAEVTAGL